MIKFDILNRFSGAVQITVEIDCEEGADRSVKLGLAVKWAVENRANLDGANLNRASLYGANLNRANLYGANLYGANLNRANLNRANLYAASLYGANLYGANLNRANLNRANLYGANLNRANLNRASLYGANLNRANLDGASLDGANGINDYVKCIQIDRWPVTYTHDTMQIGCQRHLISEWREFDDRAIAAMDGKHALKFWRRYKGWIFQAIELCPATPTKTSAQGDEPSEAAE